MRTKARPSAEAASRASVAGSTNTATSWHRPAPTQSASASNVQTSGRPLPISRLVGLSGRIFAHRSVASVKPLG